MQIDFYGTEFNFNPRSLTGATHRAVRLHAAAPISIHAPSRERLFRSGYSRGSRHFNPRSLTGATTARVKFIAVSIFQSTLPHGSDGDCAQEAADINRISIHAPSRERRRKNDLLYIYI